MSIDFAREVFALALDDSSVNQERNRDNPGEQHKTGPHYGKGPTTHSEYGAGHPRLVGIGFEDPAQRPVFHLEKEVTTIGSAPDNDIVIDGILPHHATISHTETDEYALDSLGETETSSAGEESPYNEKPQGARLRHGSVFRVGGLEFSFQRSEYADHGRPFGGREGGEFERQPIQDPAPDYRDAHRRASDSELARAPETRSTGKRPEDALPGARVLPADE